MAPDLRILPLHCGALQLEKSVAVYLKDCGTAIEAPSLIFLILGGEKTILVDTTFSTTSPNPGIKHTASSRTPDQEPAARLKAAGVDPRDVDLVLFTHLHWDHSQNNALFPNARFLVSRAELRYAICPLSTQAVAYEAPVPPSRCYPAWVRDRTVFEPMALEHGPCAVAPGVTYFHTPGHTPGAASIAVETPGGAYVIAGDAVNLYENIELMLPGGITHSQEDAMESMRRILQVASTPRHVLPGHDIRVMDRDVYN